MEKKCRVVGIEDASYQSKSGEIVTGLKLHVLSDYEKVNGKQAESVYFGGNSSIYNKALSAKISDDIVLLGTYGKRGFWALDINIPAPAVTSSKFTAAK